VADLRQSAEKFPVKTLVQTLQEIEYGFALTVGLALGLSLSLSAGIGAGVALLYLAHKRKKKMSPGDSIRVVVIAMLLGTAVILPGEIYHNFNWLEFNDGFQQAWHQ
jgi:hypothetical protein